MYRILNYYIYFREYVVKEGFEKMDKLKIFKTDKEVKKMSTNIKPINAITYVTEKKYVDEIKKSLTVQSSSKVRDRNTYSINLLRKARRG